MSNLDLAVRALLYLIRKSYRRYVYNIFGWAITPRFQGESSLAFARISHK
jgi:hypothetical protein